MGKPVVFFSHSSRDEPVLRRLKDLILAKTGSTIDVFLSSDGQSIPLGRNWVYRIEAALSETAVMFVFISPNSLASHWLYFEAGYTYARKIRVVPIGALGLDLSSVGPPLGLLQGFNIRDADGLNNLVAVINVEFGFSHPLSFTDADLDALLAASPALEQAYFGEHTPSIRLVAIHLSSLPPDSEQSANQFLADQGHTYQLYRGEIHTYGMSLKLTEKGYGSARIDPAPLARSLHILDSLLAQPALQTASRDKLLILLSPSVGLFDERVNLTARILGSDIALGENGTLTFHGLKFNLQRDVRPSGLGATAGPPYIEVLSPPAPFATLPLRELIDLLFYLGVLFYEEASGWA